MLWPCHNICLPNSSNRVSQIFSQGYCSGFRILGRYSTLYEIKLCKTDINISLGKGVGRIQIEPNQDLTVDVFVTHTIADGSESVIGNNTWHRIKQVEELMEKHVRTSKADAIILGGDFNFPPNPIQNHPYEIILRDMKNCASEVLQELNSDKFATYGNPKNSYSFMEPPMIADYIFLKSNNPQTFVQVQNFELPNLQTIVHKNHKLQYISLSDHEPVLAKIHIMQEQ